MTRKGPNTTAAKVEEYVSKHPRCLKSDIVRDLGILKNTATGTLNRLRGAGTVKRIDDTVDVDGKSYPVTRWEIGCEPGVMAKDFSLGAPRRKFSKTWEPHLHRDPLVAQFFLNHNKENTQDEEALAS